MTPVAPRRGRVVVVGSLNADQVVRVERIPRPGETVLADGVTVLAGGKGANQAVAAAAAGAHVTLVGVLGDDAFGAAYRRRLAALGIGTSLTPAPPGIPTGQALVTVDDDAENSIVVVPGANATLAPQHLAALDDLGPGDVLLVQLEIPLRTVVAAVRRASSLGARIVLNCAPYALLPADVVALADPLVTNEHEARLVGEAGLAPRSWLVTYGAAGVSWSGRTYVAPEVPAEQVVDTTGAGDAFAGTLAAALAAGSDEAAAVAAAMDAGAAAVRRFGAQADPRLSDPVGGSSRLDDEGGRSRADPAQDQGRLG